MIEIRWREMPSLSVRWIAPTPMGLPVAVRPKASGLTAVFGPPGRDGLDGGSAFDATAARALSGHRALILTEAGADYPDLDTPGHGDRIVGISTGAVASGADITIQAAGEIEESSWSWTPGPVFAADNGLLTQSVPAGAWLRQVAVAFAPTRMVIDLRPSILLN